MSIDDLAIAGPPVRLRDLCELTGCSKMKFFRDIERGKLHARWIQTATTRMVVIDRAEALRYLQAIEFPLQFHV